MRSGKTSCDLTDFLKEEMAEFKELTGQGHKRGNTEKQVEIRGLKGQKEESPRMTRRFPP